MGQARRRGTREQRVTEAQVRIAEERERERAAHEAYLNSPAGRKRARGSLLAAQLLVMASALSGGFR